MKLFQWLLDLVYPPKCVFCGKLLKSTEAEICKNCRFSLPEVDHVIKRGEFFRECWSVYYYEDAVVDSIHRYKFSGMQHYADAYGRLLAMLLLRKKVTFDVLTWVPVSAKRRRKRGYDQAFLLAQSVARELHVPCRRTLNKVRDNQAQSSILEAERRRGNVQGCYAAVNEEDFQGKTVLLIDDVITTGSTLSECSRVLRTAGAAQVICATLSATQSSDRKKQ